MTKQVTMNGFASAFTLLARATALAMALAGCPSRTSANDADSSHDARLDAAAPSAALPMAMPTPAPAGSAERGRGTVKRLDAGALVPLKGPRVSARGDDWVLENEGRVAVVSARGALVDFGVRGGSDELVTIEPAAFIGLDAQRTELVAIDPVDAGARRALAVRKRVVGSPLVLTTFYSFAGPVLEMESVLTTTGQGVAAVTLGETIAWGNVPTWVEGLGFVPQRAATHSGEFIGREGFGVAYALGSNHGRTIARFGTPDPGFHEAARTGEDTVSVAPGTESPRRVVSLAVAPSIGDAASLLPRARSRGELERWPMPLALPAGVHAEVARCGGSVRGAASAGAPYASFAATRDEASSLALPRGCWLARLGARGQAPGPWTPVRELATRDAATLRPRAGLLRYSATEKGRGAIPARIVVRGVAPTVDPDWGEDGADGAALDTIYFERAGERAIPPGRYRATVTRGFEYTAREIAFEVRVGEAATIAAELERVVDTRGWMAADLHVHAVPSADAPARLEDRVRSLVASGIEVAVATDHNAITDYAPTIRELALSPFIASIVGDEITTRGFLFGHFNAFPLDVHDAPVAYDGVTPKILFAAARAAVPSDRDKVLQVNHPRMEGIGYFDLLRFDPEAAASWTTMTPLADLSFDALEVFNGDDIARIANVERVMRDWYALLNAGFRVTATGNSDSHKLTYQEAGVPRNLVFVGEDAPEKLDERVFVDAVRKGHVVVSSGPFLRLEVNGKSVGDDVPEGEADIHVHVEAPPWVDVDRVDIVRRGEVERSFDVRAADKTVRLDEHLRVALRKGDWVVAVARGRKPMTFLHRAGVTPFAFTNPVWVK